MSVSIIKAESTPKGISYSIHVTPAAMEPFTIKRTFAELVAFHYSFTIPLIENSIIMEPHVYFNNRISPVPFEILPFPRGKRDLTEAELRDRVKQLDLYLNSLLTLPSHLTKSGAFVGFFNRVNLDEDGTFAKFVENSAIDNSFMDSAELKYPRKNKLENNRRKHESASDVLDLYIGQDDSDKLDHFVSHVNVFISQVNGVSKDSQGKATSKAELLTIDTRALNTDDPADDSLKSPRRFNPRGESLSKAKS
jgi:hypothetical protein